MMNPDFPSSYLSSPPTPISRAEGHQVISSLEGTFPRFPTTTEAQLQEPRDCHSFCCRHPNTLRSRGSGNRPGEQIWRIHHTGVSSTSKNTFMRVPGIMVSCSEMCSDHRTTNNLARMPQRAFGG